MIINKDIFQNIKAVLFDLDGTLVDSMWLWEDIDKEYLSRFDITLPDDLQDMIQGMSFSETAVYFKERFLIPHSLEDIKADWNKMAWKKYAEEVPLKEGVLSVLKELRNRGISMGIATSNSKELVELVIGKLGVAKYFSSIRTSCEVAKGKPSPDIYQLVAKDLGAEPAECLVFEDIIAGILAGKSAGMKVCSVYDKKSEGDTKKKQELSDYYIHTFSELLNI
ncbi:HAD family phosphatase [Anaerocolumna sp. AGMB13020]|nr:HAD family phosphatase [Anaerocolumna sp. AGMB13020]WOO36580.1 HAD family phosphatase [Anaerocolumna sp. AGMB13020]